jgi:hypothetical protein
MAGGNRSCSEYKTTELDREFTTDMTVDLPITSKGFAPPLKASPGTTVQRVMENAVNSEAELRSAPESETGGWACLLSWIVNTLTVFVILPITLSAAVFVYLIAAHYIHHLQHHKQGEVSCVAPCSDLAVPLLETPLTADITNQHAGYENRGSYGVGGTENHVYERND